MADLDTLREIITESAAKSIAPDNPRDDPRPRAYRSQPPELAIKERQASALEAIAKELKRYNDNHFVRGIR
jgi:hypothetical protein